MKTKTKDFARTSVKYLMLVNLFAYVHIFFLHLYYLERIFNAHFDVNFSLFSVAIIGGFLPYIVLVATTIIFSYELYGSCFRKEAIFDWLLRLVAYIVVYQQFSFSIMSGVVLTGLIILFLASLLTEYRMYQKAKNFNPEKHLPRDEVDVTVEETDNVYNILLAFLIGVGSLIVVVVFSMSIPVTVLTTEASLRKTIIIISSILAFIWFFELSYRKCNLYYLDEKAAKKVLINDTTYATVGYLLSVVFISRIGCFWY